MFAKHDRGYAWVVAVVAAGAVAGALLHAADPAGFGQWLHWVCKPLVTALIFALAWRVRPALSPRYRCWILAGIACSLFGDVFLMLPQDLFVAGLLAFLLGHLCFIVAFLGDSRFGARPGWLLACLGYGAVNLYLLWGAIGAPLRLPVIVYVIVLACMGAQAVARSRELRRGTALAHGAKLAAAGAVMFMLSDSVLAWDRFRGPLPLASVWILATYYLSLWWIARSVQGGAVEALA